MSTNENESTGTKTSSREEQLARLAAAGKKVEKERAERKGKAVKGGHLKDGFLEAARSAGNLTVEEKSGFYKITGKAKGRAVYLATKGGRVDLSGFSLDCAGVTPITAEEAKDRHIGKVRGQLDFEADDVVLSDAFAKALFELSVDVPEEPKPERPKKEKKEKSAPKPPKAKAEEPAEETEAEEEAPADEAEGE